MWHPLFAKLALTSLNWYSSLIDTGHTVFFYVDGHILDQGLTPATPGTVVYSASNRNEYEKQKNNVSGEQSTADA
jgi:hypothetical protein